MSRIQNKRYDFGREKIAQIRFLMLEAVNIAHCLFSTFPPFFLQEAKQLPRNIPPMNFTACIEKN